MRLLLYGGTFDPPHIGHLVAANEVRLVGGFDEIQNDICLIRRAQLIIRICTAGLQRPGITCPGRFYAAVQHKGFSVSE